MNRKASGEERAGLCELTSSGRRHLQLAEKIKKSRKEKAGNRNYFVVNPNKFIKRICDI
jgi:hypothetical protein